MYLDQYQNRALKTAKFDHLVIPPAVYCALGLAGESGEVVEKVKKIYRDREGVLTHEDRLALTKELGDVLWYVAVLAHEVGLNLHYVADLNLAKLASRQQRDAIQGEGDER